MNKNQRSCNRTVLSSYKPEPRFPTRSTPKKEEINKRQISKTVPIINIHQNLSTTARKVEDKQASTPKEFI